ncbi:YHS domain-containing (seleno)protein [Kordiimonas pumila]|uniref:YHS domain-containing (Seleno)protein n=1 Tax=Kordiimonas pumila TaxID=2161677 RepID=A0ABV7D7Z7_9PROT|nr:YHS domain-containing (seleno)protein [Kordiimonas pumila]
MKKLSIRICAIIFMMLAFGSFAQAGDDPVYTGTFSNVAVGGYDTVVYFTEGQPIKGNKKFSTDYKGAQWRFVNAENKALFLAHPEQYAPQYGGYCAWAVSQGYTASGDPTVWKIVDGKLYLNYNDDVKAKWEQDIPAFIKSADKNFPNLVDAPE